MAPYATVSDVLERVSRDDLAERAAPNDREVNGDLLQAYVSGGRGAELPGYAEAADGPALEAAVERAAGRISDALGDAGAKIDGYIAVRYPDPPATADATLRAVSLDIFLFEFFGGGGDDGYEKRYDRALIWLSDVARGRIDLAPAAGGGDAAGGIGGVSVDSRPEIFTDTALGGYLSGV